MTVNASGPPLSPPLTWIVYPSLAVLSVLPPIAGYGSAPVTVTLMMVICVESGVGIAGGTASTSV